MVRVVEVHPGEHGPRVGLGQEGERAVDGRLAAHLGHHGLGLVGLELVGVVAEPAGQAVAAVEDDRAHEGARAIAAAQEGLGERGEARAQHERPVLVDAVARRDDAREEARVRGQRRGDVAVGAPEDHALARQRVERGGHGGVAAVAAQPVGAGGVERDEDHVGPLGRLVEGALAPPRPQAGDPQGRPDDDGDRTQDPEPPASHRRRGYRGASARSTAQNV
jgi:hypothetical protein